MHLKNSVYVYLCVHSYYLHMDLPMFGYLPLSVFLLAYPRHMRRSVISAVSICRALIQASTENRLAPYLDVSLHPLVKDVAKRPCVDGSSSPQGICFSSLFPDASPQALDLLRRLLAFNPSKRITALEALRHPYFKVGHAFFQC